MITPQYGKTEAPGPFMVEGNAQSVYVHDSRGITVARLGRCGGEFAVGDPINLYRPGPHMSVIVGCTFEKFQEECKTRFGVDVSPGLSRKLIWRDAA